MKDRWMIKCAGLFFSVYGGWTTLRERAEEFTDHAYAQELAQQVGGFLVSVDEVDEDWL